MYKTIKDKDGKVIYYESMWDDHLVADGYKLEFYEDAPNLVYNDGVITIKD